MKMIPRWMCAALASGLLLGSPLRADWQVRVSAGDHDRLETVVRVPLPSEARGALALETDGGELLPLQVDDAGEGWFVLPRLAQGETVTYKLVLRGEPDPLTPWVEVLPERGRLRLSLDGQPVFFYQAEERGFTRPDLNPLIKRGGFIHPVMAPSGKVVSQSYPTGHPHHQGIWSPWTRTVFAGENIDFWNMHRGNGKVEFEEIDKTWSGPVQGGFKTRHRFVVLTGETPVTALNETWTVRLYQTGDRGRAHRVFDLGIYQETAGEEPLHLPQAAYGGLGFRGRDEWIGAENTFFLTSEGETDRGAGNHTRMRWVHVSGMVDGARTGIAILGHPDNFRAPQPARLHPREPFVCFVPSQLGEWEITPDSPYTANYRFVVMDGDPDAGEIDRLWNDYAEPPRAEVVAASGDE